MNGLTLNVRESTRRFYHTGESSRDDYNPKTFRRKTPQLADRKVIAWDMEGMSLSGLDSPQHPVMFGCSAEPEQVLIDKCLSTRAMCEHIVEIGEKYPNALHVGYAFKYDANMIIYGLSEQHIVKLWKTNHVSFRFDSEYVWSIRWIPGKMFTVSKRWGKKRNTRAKVSVTIYDYSSFFGGKFIDAAESILGKELTEDDRDVIAHGKANRGDNEWEDLKDVHYYWLREIQLIRRTFEVFRDVMTKAGFPLSQWYGPGALANYINTSRRIHPHLGGVQQTGGFMPNTVHEAAKIAFSGGRFELFQAGRVTGPIYASDISSAYPYALTKIPSLHPDEGQWEYVSSVAKIARFGVYHVKFRSPQASPIEYRPMPLFWRDNRGLISYPAVTHGWYWSPEAAMIQRISGAEIIEGWEWRSNERVFPWAFLQEMYDERMRIGKKNLLSMPFKLGPNSLYGKYAQTVGWNQKEMLPPKSHALSVAGWTTSYCRAMLHSAILQNPMSVISVETDAIYSTERLSLPYGTQLGEWSTEVYDEMIYLQSGMYHYKQDGVWKGVRSRGMNRGEFPQSQADSYLKLLRGGEEWPSLELWTNPKFIGAGAAIAAKEPLREIMCSWRSQKKEFTLGDTGKRMHVAKACPECRDGTSPYDKPHRLAIRSRSNGHTMSVPRSLPWESKYSEEVQTIRDSRRIESELIDA